MSIVNIFTSKAPQLGGLEFDAILEDTLEVSATITGYTVEVGVRVGDHRVINPIRWRITGAVSNNPIRPGVTDFIGAVLPSDNPILAGAAGVTAGMLSGSDESRAGSALEYLIELVKTGEPFDVSAGDIDLTNMVIEKLSRTKDPENEEALIFIAELTEFPYLSTALSYAQPDVSQLPADDSAQSQAAGSVSRGTVAGSAPSAATSGLVSGVL